MAIEPKLEVELDASENPSKEFHEKLALQAHMHTCALRFDRTCSEQGEWVVVLLENGESQGERWNETLSAALVVMEFWIRYGVAPETVTVHN